MAIQKKYAKMGIAALAVAALIIGLSVGISQSNKNRSTASSSQANGMEHYDEEYTCSSKSSKATHSSGSTKSSKSSSTHSSGKSGDEPDVTTTVAPTRRRKLSVPGTEDYERVNLGLGAKMKARRGE